jgi:hypothetical protein
LKANTILFELWVAIREGKEGEAVFLGFGVVSASVTGFSNMLLR